MIHSSGLSLLIRIGILFSIVLMPILFSAGWKAEKAYLEYLEQSVWMLLTLYSTIIIFLLSATRNVLLLWLLRVVEVFTIALLLYMAWIQPSAALAFTYALFAMLWMSLVLADMLLSQNWCRAIMTYVPLIWLMSFPLAGIGLLLKLPLPLAGLLIGTKVSAALLLLGCYLSILAAQVISQALSNRDQWKFSDVGPSHQDIWSSLLGWLAKPIATLIMCRKRND